MALTPRQARFVAEYLKDLNGTQAAIRAGYARGSADVQGARLLGVAKVREAVDLANAKRAAKLGLSAEKILANIERLADAAEETGDLSVAMKGHELLGKHFRLFTDRIEHSGSMTLEQLVLAAKASKAGG